MKQRSFKIVLLTTLASLVTIAVHAAFTPMNIPVTGYDPDRLGLPIPYGSPIALDHPDWSYTLLSGGTAVRMNTRVVGTDETWEIVPADGSTGGYVRYGDRVAFSLPYYSDTHLSGGSQVTSNAPTIGATETWVIESLEYDKTGEEVLLGEFVVLRMPDVGDLLLSGGSAVRTDVTAIGPDEIWQLLQVSAP